MNGLLWHLRINLRLYFRNKVGMFFGYIFPVLLLVAFHVLYRHEKVPLVRHMGELLTVCVLGGACLGLPITIVAERERGVWRRYRMVPLSTWSLVVSSVVGRYFLIVTAGLLQWSLALGLGTPLPDHPLQLFVAFTFVAFAFIGLGLVVAMVADNVPAVQALGQCIFLPMLIIGGVAVPLAALSSWAQHIAAFFPGMYAVEALQACVNGSGLASTGFSLQSLAVIGAAGCIAGAKMFRWDAQQRLPFRGNKAWVTLALTACAGVGLLAEIHGRVAVSAEGVEPAPRVVAAAIPVVSPAPVTAPVTQVAPPVSPPAPEPAPAAPPAAAAPAVPPDAPKSWQAVTMKNINELDYRVPPDRGVVTPIAGPDDEPDDETRQQLDDIRAKLPYWNPGQVPDVVQRVRNILFVAAVPDAVQMQIERYLPAIVLEYLQDAIPSDRLVKILCWIVLHPEEGDDTAIDDMEALGFPPFGVNVGLARERSYYYAIKFIGRLTGRIKPAGEMARRPNP